MKDEIISTFSNDLKELIENIIIQNQKIFVTLKAKSPEDAKKLEKFKIECIEKISSFKKFNEVNVTFTLIKKKFSKIIAISSCKGGVGKSTVSVNIAHSLKSMGYKVGILDCDIYGPSIPKLLNINQKPDVDENKKILPIIHDGIEVISIGLMINEDKPIIWRGPMIQSALMQLINEVKWSQLDFLVLDMPPGTGDVHLTIAQKLKIDHAVVVTTSEEIAIADTRKGINMLLKFNIPISGIIENMSYLICKDGTKDFLFGEYKAEELAKEFNTNFLGKIPFDRSFFKTINQEDFNNSNQTQIINSITKKLLKLSD